MNREELVAAILQFNEVNKADPIKGCFLTFQECCRIQGMMEDLRRFSIGMKEDPDFDTDVSWNIQRFFAGIESKVKERLREPRT